MSKIASKQKAAFTLLELLIVILLISIFYYLVSGSFKRDNKSEVILSLDNIRQYPLNKLPNLGAELVCINDCQNCYIYNYTTQQSIAIKSSIPKLKAYILNRQGEAVHINFGRINDKPICLRFRYYPNGSSSELIIFANNEYYYLPPYFGKIEKFSSLSDAIDRYNWVEGKFTDKSDYY